MLSCCAQSCRTWPHRAQLCHMQCRLVQFGPSGSENDEATCNSVLLVVPQPPPLRALTRPAQPFPAHLPGESSIGAHYPTTKTPFLHTGTAAPLPEGPFCTFSAISDDRALGMRSPGPALRSVKPTLAREKVPEQHNGRGGDLDQHVVEPELVHTKPHERLVENEANKRKHDKDGKLSRATEVSPPRKHKAHRGNIVKDHRNGKRHPGRENRVPARPLRECHKNGKVDARGHNSHDTELGKLPNQLRHVASFCAQELVKNITGLIRWGLPRIPDVTCHSVRTRFGSIWFLHGSASHLDKADVLVEFY